MKKKIFRWHPRKILICSLSPYPYPHCNIRLEFPKLDGGVFRKGFFTGFVWFLQIDLNFFERENTHLETGFVFCRRCPLLSIFQKSHTAIFDFTSIRPLVSKLVGLDRLIWLCEWLWLKTRTIFSTNQSQSCKTSRLVLSGVHYDHFGFAFATYSPRVRVLYTGNVSFKLNILGWVMVKK